MCSSQRADWLWLLSANSAPKIMPVPGDPLELAAGQVPVAATNESRQAAFDLLARARDNFLLRSTGQGYDLKINFTVDSQGQTNYDGAWETGGSVYPRTRTPLDGESRGRIRHHRDRLQRRALRRRDCERGSAAPGGSARDPAAPASVGGLCESRIDSNRPQRRSTAQRSPAFCCRVRTAPRSRPWGGDGTNRKSVSIPNPGCSRCTPRCPGATSLTITRTRPGFGGHTLPRTVTVTEAGRVVSKISVEKLQEIHLCRPGSVYPHGVDEGERPVD